MAFNATADNVIIQLEQEDKTTASGLVIPQGTGPLPDVAQVIAVGPDVSTVNPGDMVVFKHNMAHGVEIEGGKYVHVPLAGIVAIITSN
jgi:co-chaperonin GroES (HSP10)